MKFRYLLIVFLLSFSFINIYGLGDTTSDDHTSDRLEEGEDFFEQSDFPEDKLKRSPVIFNMGGQVILKSRLLMGRNSQYFQLINGGLGGFEPLPNNKWDAETGANMWGRLTFTDDRYLHFKVSGLFRYSREGIVPLFNVDELYLNWRYPLGKVRLGRTNYNLRAATVFNGPLDGVQINIDVPFLNFKSFVGYSGLLGLFNPYFNPYKVSAYDRSYVEQTDLASSVMVVQVNSTQSRRIFFAMDFDINFFGQHVNPYFLLQYDVSSVPVAGFNNNDYTVNTVHLGLNLEGRIAPGFYYQAHLSGLFGANQVVSSLVSTPIIACALQTKLRYTIPKSKGSTFVLGYALGTDNGEKRGSFWSDTGLTNINKYYYYGKFDGGFVLSPVLSNIHSLSFKFMVTPVNSVKGKLTIAAAFFQTFKINSAAPISDEQSNQDSYVVGSEIDLNFLITVKKLFTIGIDAGLFIPETAYSDMTPRIRMGASLAVSF